MAKGAVFPSSSTNAQSIPWDLSKMHFVKFVKLNS